MIPEPKRAYLDELTRRLVAALGDDPTGVHLMDSAAAGGHRPGVSDLDVWALVRAPPGRSPGRRSPPPCRRCRARSSWPRSAGRSPGTAAAAPDALARDTQPITVAIFSQLRQFGSNIDLIAPAAFVSLAIPLALFFAVQRYFVQGLLAGAVK